ncbi:MAG: thiol-activated cytolysin family protein [Porphyromonadaceae bacterium]|nr:thiol-activated cytolysin family protein [Porphyromonadaceae bacterium]
MLAIKLEQAVKEQGRLSGLDSLFSQDLNRQPSASREFRRQMQAQSQGQPKRMLPSSSPNVLKDAFYAPIKRVVSVDGCEYSDLFQHALPVDVIWPGNIIDITSAQRNVPTEITALQPYRAKGRISLAVVSGQENLVEEITSFDKSSIYESLNSLIGKNKKGLPADIVFSSHLVRSESEMAYFMGVTKEEYEQSYKSSFAGVRWEENTYKMLVQLRQVFFTVVFDDPSPSASRLFTSSLTVEKFKQLHKGRAPLGYISSVSYGRSFVMLVEEKQRTYRDEGEMKKAVEVYSPQYKSRVPHPQFSQVNVFVRQIGGKTLPVQDILLKSPEKLLSFLAEHATFGPDNIGYPIAYRIKALGDLKPVLYRNEIKDKYEFIDYELVEDTNKVTIDGITLNIKGLGEKTEGGDYPHVSNYSFFRLHQCKVSILPDDDDKQDYSSYVKKYVGGADISGIDGASIRVPYTFVTPELGVTPRAAIQMELNLMCHASTYSNGFIGIGGGRKSRDFDYKVFVEFRYDISKGCWMVRHTGATSHSDFKNFGVNTVLNHCRVSFDVDYSFRTDQKTY